MKHFQSNKNNFLSRTAMLGPTIGLLFLLLAFVVSCGSDSAGPTTASTDTIYSGFIFDSAVGGLGYDCGNGVVSTNGLTESTGKFYYPTSAVCTLSLGKVTIASFSPANTADLHYTPYDIWADDALSAARLLQTLDGSGNLDDGIQIPATLANITGTIDLSKDLASAADNPGVTEALTALGKTTADLVSESDATAHFQSSALNLAADAVKIKTLYTSKEQINLPSIVKVGVSSNVPVAVTWSSSDNTCVSDTGSITASSRCSAKLTGSFTYDTASKTKTFRVIYDVNAKDYGDFIVSDAYIDFHSYRGDVISQIEGDMEVTFLLSSSATSPDRNTIDPMAYIERRFVKDDAVLGARKIYLGWTDKFNSKNYSNALFPNNKVDLETETDFSSYVPFILRKNLPYYLHIYYTKDGTAKTISHSFRTPDYPNTKTEADAMFPGFRAKGAIVSLFMATGTDLVDIERKASEPIIFDAFSWGPGNTGTVRTFMGGVGQLACVDQDCATTGNGFFVFKDDTRNASFGTRTVQTGQLLVDWLYIMKPTKPFGLVKINDGSDHHLFNYIEITE